MSNIANCSEIKSPLMQELYETKRLRGIAVFITWAVPALLKFYHLFKILLKLNHQFTEMF